MEIPEFTEIVEQNDQTAARREHLEKLREMIGNAYPNKFVRSRISDDEDTITGLLAHGPIAAVGAEISEIVAGLAERERPPAEVKDALNARLRELGDVRIAGRMAVPPRVMGKAAFVHLSDGISRLQIYVRRDDVQGIYNGSEPGAVATGPDEGKTGTTKQHEDTRKEDIRNKNPKSVSGWEIFQLLDHGDFIGVEGYLFITNTGELSVHVERLEFLAKAMLPMPDKMHGIADPEIRQRQRYADLIASSLQIDHEGLTTRQVFERRAKIISSMRHFLEDHGYVEVETPMLTPKATGAAAKPFKTHHNALDIDLYARIAPELYLKRLVVGGFEKVYELNRNFRNEGISYKHNPEFTMLEFYCAYMDVNGMMDFCEKMLQESVLQATGGLVIEYEGKTIDFSKFERVSMKEAIVNVSARGGFPPGFEAKWLDDYKKASALARFTSGTDSGIVTLIRDFNSEPQFRQVRASEVPEFLAHGWRHAPNVYNAAERQPETTWEWYLGETEAVDDLQTQKTIVANSIAKIFEFTVEKHLIQPTFIIDFPKSISPLSKASPENPQIAERFELFINGMEIANGFSELNDPKEQYDRFIDQASERERGDEEAMVMDEDYIRALSYGMPPAAGIGVGIDRLVMLLTNKHSIRDVILFPHMRPERKLTTEDTESTE